MGLLIFTIYEVTKTSVTVNMDDETIMVYTHSSTVGEVLEEQHIQLGDHDIVQPSIHTEITEALNIVYQSAQKVFVTLDGEKEEVWTTAKNVDELLDELSIVMNKRDTIYPSIDTAIEENMAIYHESAFRVVVKSDGEEKEVWTTATTVESLLGSENYTLNELDRVEPSIESSIDEEVEIKIVRVEKVTDVVEEKVNFNTVKKNDSSLVKGKEQVIESGQDGRVKKYYEVVFEDGEEVSRDLVKEEEVTEMKERVLAVGTKAPAPTVTQNVSRSSAVSDSTGEWRTFAATAYTANCRGCSGTTATGINLHQNPNAKVIAVDPRVIPLGSRVEIKGMGTFIAGDTGGAIKGNKVDIFRPNDARSFGRQTIQLRVVK